MRSKLPRKPQPVPPIFDLAVAASAIVWSAHHPRRELLVAGPTLEAVLANKIVPGWLDHYPAHFGYESQMTSEPEDPHRPDSLDHPLDDQTDHAARGPFVSRSRHTSWELLADLHCGAIAALGGGLLGVACAVYLGRSRYAHP